MSIEELRAEAVKLDPESRARLARELLASLDGITEGEVQKLRVDEAIRREGELEKGKVHAYPAEDVMGRAR